MSSSKQRYILKRKLNDLELLAKNSGYWISDRSSFLSTLSSQEKSHTTYFGAAKDDGLFYVVEVINQYYILIIVRYFLYSNKSLLPNTIILNKLVNLIKHNDKKRDILNYVINNTREISLGGKEEAIKLCSDPEKLDIKINILYIK